MYSQVRLQSDQLTDNTWETESSELAQMSPIENEPHMQSPHVHYASADMLQLVSGTRADEVYPDVVNIVVSYTEHVFSPEAFAANPQLFGGNFTAQLSTRLINCNGYSLRVLQQELFPSLSSFHLFFFFHKWLKVENNT